MLDGPPTNLSEPGKWPKDLTCYACLFVVTAIIMYVSTNYKSEASSITLIFAMSVLSIVVLL